MAEEFRLIYEPKPTKVHNIILIGDTRTGKTTFLNYLTNLDFKPNIVEIFSGTVDPVVQDFSINLDGIRTISVIDTPGFNEVKEDGTSRTNTMISCVVKNMTSETITRISMVVLFVNASSGLVDTQMTTVDFLINELGPQIWPNLCLMVTKAEEYDEEDELKFIKSLSHSESYKRIYEACQAGIYFTGAYHGKNQEVLRDFKSRQCNRMLKFLKSVIEQPPITLIDNRYRSNSMMVHGSDFFMDVDELRKLITEVQSLINSFHTTDERVNRNLCMFEEPPKEIVERRLTLVKELPEIESFIKTDLMISSLTEAGALREIFSKSVPIILNLKLKVSRMCEVLRRKIQDSRNLMFETRKLLK